MIARSFPAACLLVSVALLAPAPGLATHGSDWPTDANLNVSLVSALYNQSNPRIVTDGQGGAIVVWEDQRDGLVDRDLYVQRVDYYGRPLWTADGVAICTASGDQFDPVITSDGAGGAIIAWTDDRGPSRDIYAQRVSASGATQWTANGLGVCTVSGFQQIPSIVSDGAGGAVIAWGDASGPISALRLTSTGAIAPGSWVANGVLLTPAPANPGIFRMITDGSGGAIVVWEDYRASNADIYAQRVTAAGTIPVIEGWSASGNALCTNSAPQLAPSIVPDGQGGAIVAWQDQRNSGTTLWDLFAQRLTRYGTMVWFPNGIAFCTASGNQLAPKLTTDGAGGAIAAWQDSRGADADVYSIRLTPQGGVASGWPANGLALCTATGGQSGVSLTTDGAGGAYVIWQDPRFDINGDAYAARVKGSGALAQGWPANGAVVSNAIAGQLTPVSQPEVLGGIGPGPELLGVTPRPDGFGGVIVAWRDNRPGGGGSDVFAQRMDRLAYLGSPAPVIADVSDVPGDQGGRVKLSWHSSYLDNAPYNFVDLYWIFRSVPPNLAVQQITRGARLTTAPEEAAEPGRRALLTTSQGGSTYFWEFVASQSAYHFLTGYSAVVSTLGDSVAGYNPSTLFMVQARQGFSEYYWSSLPDSGYSVDNLAPAMPQPFAGAYSGGATALHWGANTEPDFAVYHLYRGTSAGFAPGAGNLIATLPDTGYVDAGPAGFYYKLSALDTHGNESPFALLTPQDITGVAGAALPASVWLASPWPNPASDGVTLRFALPRAGRVALSLHDVSGRRVRELVRAVLPAGEHTARWDGRDAAGRPVPNGLYLARLDALGAARVRRVAVTR